MVGAIVRTLSKPDGSVLSRRGTRNRGRLVSGVGMEGDTRNRRARRNDKGDGIGKEGKDWGGLEEKAARALIQPPHGIHRLTVIR